MSVRLQLVKLRPWDGHVHIVALTDASGAEYDGPGTDLRGEAAEKAFALARPMIDVLREVEPGLELRSLSIDLPRRRILVTSNGAPGSRPRVVRVDDGPLYDRLLAAAGPLLDELAQRMEVALARRERPSPPP